MTEFHLFLPQMRMDFPTLVTKARSAEAAGFTGVALIDHLAPPMAEQHPMYDAMITAAWLGAHTDRLTIGHLVLCDGFRHPAVLAKQIVSLDHASGGRFELGIGWGSVPREFVEFGVGSSDNGPRFARFAETLEVLELLLGGEPVHYDGVHHHIDGGVQQPVPTREIPIVIGGGGPKTMGLVAQHATWWNCPTYALGRFDELKAKAGDARVSVQHRVALLPDASRRDEITELTIRRYGPDQSDLVIGTTDEVRAHHEELIARGVERIYAWFTDFAPAETLEAYGAEVIAALR